MTDVPWWVYAVAVLLVLAVAGRVERRLQRWRFGLTLHIHGYESHQDYVSHGLWSARRHRFIREHGDPPCRLCSGQRDHTHHLSYARAGAGRERDRDLMAVSDRCHLFIHGWDRRLRRVGVPLRWTSWLCVGMLWPVRLVRGRRVSWGTRSTTP
jgi:hypothetical protein